MPLVTYQQELKNVSAHIQCNVEDEARIITQILDARDITDLEKFQLFNYKIIVGMRIASYPKYTQLTNRYLNFILDSLTNQIISAQQVCEFLEKTAQNGSNLGLLISKFSSAHLIYGRILQKLTEYPEHHRSIFNILSNANYKKNHYGCIIYQQEIALIYLSLLTQLLKNNNVTANEIFALLNANPSSDIAPPVPINFASIFAKTAVMNAFIDLLLLLQQYGVQQKALALILMQETKAKVKGEDIINSFNQILIYHNDVQTLFRLLQTNLCHQHTINNDIINQPIKYSLANYILNYPNLEERKLYIGQVLNSQTTLGEIFWAINNNWLSNNQPSISRGSLKKFQDEYTRLSEKLRTTPEATPNNVYSLSQASFLAPKRTTTHYNQLTYNMDTLTNTVKRSCN